MKIVSRFSLILAFIFILATPAVAQAQVNHVYDSFEDGDRSNKPFWSIGETSVNVINATESGAVDGSFVLENSGRFYHHHTSAQGDPIDLENVRNWSTYIKPTLGGDSEVNGRFGISSHNDLVDIGGDYDISIFWDSTDTNRLNIEHHVNGNTLHDFESIGGWNVGQWYKIEIVYDPVSDTAVGKLYDINGTLLSQSAPISITETQYNYVVGTTAAQGTTLYDLTEYTYSITGEQLNDFQALNLIDPPDNKVFVADSTDSVDVDFLFEWITQQQGVDNTDFGLVWRVKNETTGSVLFSKNYDLGTGPSAGSKSETQAFGPGNYTWQLEGTSSDAPSSFSEIFEFDIISQADSPYDITLVSPADGASLSGKKGDAASDTVNVELSFDINASQPGTFRVESGQYTNTLVSGSVSTGDNTYNVTYDFEDGNNYTWWVEVDDGQGGVYNSEQFAFSISEFAEGEEPPTQADTDNLVGLIVSGLADFFGLFVDAIEAELGSSGELTVALIISLVLAVAISYFSEFLGLLTFPSMMIVFAEAGWVSGWIAFTVAMFAIGVAIWMISRVAGGD